MKNKMKLEIKPEFNDSVITIKHPALGNVVFDTASTEPKDYQHFYDLGFGDYFKAGVKEEVQGATGPQQNTLNYVA